MKKGGGHGEPRRSVRVTDPTPSIDLTIKGHREMTMDPVLSGHAFITHGAIPLDSEEKQKKSRVMEITDRLAQVRFWRHVAMVKCRLY